MPPLCDPPKQVALRVAHDADFAALLANADGRGGVKFAEEIFRSRQIIEKLRGINAELQAASFAGSWFVVKHGTVIGHCGAKALPRGGTAEIGYGIAPSHRNNGNASCAVALLVERLKNSADVREVTARTARDNFASHAVLRKNGFEDGSSSATSQFGKLMLWRRTL